MVGVWKKLPKKVLDAGTITMFTRHSDMCMDKKALGSNKTNGTSCRRTASMREREGGEQRGREEGGGRGIHSPITVCLHQVMQAEAGNVELQSLDELQEDSGEEGGWHVEEGAEGAHSQRPIVLAAGHLDAATH